MLWSYHFAEKLNQIRFFDESEHRVLTCWNVNCTGPKQHEQVLLFAHPLYPSAKGKFQTCEQVCGMRLYITRNRGTRRSIGRVWVPKHLKKPPKLIVIYWVAPNLITIN